MKLSMPKRVQLAGLAGLIVGAFAILAIRFLNYSPETTHYHANFAVYINGEREAFSSPLYYEETNTCSTDHDANPLARAHMHGNVADVVHVEDKAVTWGQFFQNIGWDVGADFIHSPQSMYLAGQQNKLSFMLNGKRVGNVMKQVVGDKDRLLVSYGPGDEQVLEQQFDSIATTAAQYNIEKDPESCGGSAMPGMMERLKHLL